jgi:hypothetical protein
MLYDILGTLIEMFQIFLLRYKVPLKGTEAYV